MEVIFSFDTTGSMSQVLDEVKGRVSDVVQRLQADIPGFRVGIIAHGDYCDQEHFYVIRWLDLTDSVADIVTFVHATEGTGGGDVPECYELAMRQANQATWTPGSQRVLVMIGDAYPHEADYPLNTDKIDWREELEALRSKNVKIYAAQVGEDEESGKFFTSLTERTGGQLLKLANMQRICEAIMAVCYREKCPESLHTFEAEIRLKEPEKISADLEDMFGTLRREESRLSDSTALLDDEDDDIDEDDVENLGTGHSKKMDVTMETNPDAKRLSRKRKTSQDINPYNDAVDDKRTKTVRHSKDVRTPAIANKKKVHVAVTNPKPSKISRKDFRRREAVPETQFKYNHFNWSPWMLAVSPPSATTEKYGEWKTVPQSGSKTALWRRDLLNSCMDKTSKRADKSGLVFEVSIMAASSSRRRVVSCYSSRAVRSCTPKDVFGLPWYRGLFRSVRAQMNKAACSDCRVHIRFARLARATRHRNFATQLRSDYEYAWHPRKN